MSKISIVSFPLNDPKLEDIYFGVVDDDYIQSNENNIRDKLSDYIDLPIDNLSLFDIPIDDIPTDTLIDDIPTDIPTDTLIDEIYLSFGLLAEKFDYQVFRVMMKILTKLETNKVITLENIFKNRDETKLDNYIMTYLNTKCKITNFNEYANNFNNNYGDLYLNDLFKFDLRFYNVIKFNVDIIMMIFDNRYYGHIYTWFSPKVGSKYLFFIGIRSRIDNILLTECKKNVKGIAYYLLEGVERDMLYQLVNRH